MTEHDGNETQTDTVAVEGKTPKKWHKPEIRTADAGLETDGIQAQPGDGLSNLS